MVNVDIVCRTCPDFESLVNNIVRVARPLDTYTVISSCLPIEETAAWTPYYLSLVVYKGESMDSLINRAISEFKGDVLVVLDGKLAASDLGALTKPGVFGPGPVLCSVDSCLLGKVGGLRLALGKGALEDWLTRLQGRSQVDLEDTRLSSLFTTLSGVYAHPAARRAYWGLGLEATSSARAAKRLIATRFWNWCKSQSPALQVTLVPSEDTDFCCCYPNDPFLTEARPGTAYWPWEAPPPPGLAPAVSSLKVNHNWVKYPVLFANLPYRTKLEEPCLECLFSKAVNDDSQVLTHLHCFDLAKFYEVYNPYLSALLSFSYLVVTFSRSPHRIKDLIGLGVGTILWVENRGFDLGGKFAFTCFCKSLSTKSVTHYLYLHSKTCSRTRKRWFDKLVLDWKPLIQGESRFGGRCWEYSSPGWQESGRFLGYDRSYEGFQEACEYYGAKPPYTKMYDGNCFVIPVAVAERIYCDMEVYSLLNTESSYDHQWFVMKHREWVSEDLDGYWEHLSSGVSGNILAAPTERLRDGQIEHFLERVVFSLSKS